MMNGTASRRPACFAHLPPATLPVAELRAAEVLGIPLFPELTDDERAQVLAGVASFVAPGA